MTNRLKEAKGKELGSKLTEREGATTSRSVEGNKGACCAMQKKKKKDLEGQVASLRFHQGGGKRQLLSADRGGGGQIFSRRKGFRSMGPEITLIAQKKTVN